MAHKFSSTKIIPLGSTAFRQPKAQSHCRFLHGYRLQAKFWFSCENLDENHWVVDFGALKELKNILEEKFDHTTCVSAQDPELSIFKILHEKGIIDLRVFDDGVGIEKFALLCATLADQFVANITNNRCWCEKVEVWEHEGNSATVELIADKYQTHKSNAVVDKQMIIKDLMPAVSIDLKQTEPLAPPLHNTKVINSFADPFKGTSWGNSAKPKR